MIVRTFVTIVYLIAVAIAVLLQFVYPALGTYLLYALFGWFIVSFFVCRMPAMSRPLFARRPGAPSPGTGPPFAGAPLPNSPGGTPLGFCTYCATPVEPGTPVCPTCGRAIPMF